MKRYKYPSVLTIAGSDSGGAAGIQADLKTFSALGCYGTSAITAVTVQNTSGVTAIHSIPVDIVVGQIKAVMDDIYPAAIKIGMVHSVELALGIAEMLKLYPDVPVILDPVMVATSGDRLIEPQTVDVLKEILFPLAALVTPNLDEAAILTQMKIKNINDMQRAAEQLLQTGCGAALIKGGHLPGKTLYNYYLDRDNDSRLLSSTAINTNNTHGTGCSLSSAIAAFIARHTLMADAVLLASDYIHNAIAEGQDVATGKGHGPLNHFFNPLPLIKYELE